MCKGSLSEGAGAFFVGGKEAKTREKVAGKIIRKTGDEPAEFFPRLFEKDSCLWVLFLV